MKAMCAIVNCPNPAPGKVRIWCPRTKRHRLRLRSVCGKCIAKIRERHGIK